MTKYILNRILQTVLIVVIVSVISFLLVSIMPKDPVYALIGADATEEDYWTTYYRLGLDKPLFVRYFNWAAGAVSGDFGTSYAYNLPVWDILGPKLAVTIYLSTAAMLISFPLGIILGIISAVRRGKMSDTVITLIANLMSGIPQFVVAICLLYLFSMKLRLLPAIGFTFPWEDFPRHIQQIILPLTRPAFATAGVLQFLMCWNEFQFALTLTTGTEKRTLPIALYYFKSSFASDYGAMFAATVLVTVPSIIVYLLMQKQVISGLAAGSVKE